jgi:alpha-tubulin suppressor-like RCC1 family protein
MGKACSQNLSRVALGLVGSLLAASGGCGDIPKEHGTKEGIEVHVALAVVPSGVQCVRLNLSGAVASSLTFTVASGASSASLSLGYVPAGTLSLAPSAFNVACTSVTSTTVPSWTGPAATVTVVAGTPLVVPLTLEPYSVTAAVSFVPFVKSVGASRYSSYALLSDGTVRAWGSNAGDGSNLNRLLPVAVSGLSGVASLGTSSSAQGSHACVVKTSGAVSCWGNNVDGELGNGSTTSSSVPVSVSGSNLFVQVSTGVAHTCGVTTTGGISCWGYNLDGEFGNSTTTSSLVPTTPTTLHALVGPSSADEVRCGSSFTCARNGELVYCTGDNSYGQLGTGNQTRATAWTGSSLATVTALPAGLLAGDSYACEIVLSGGSVRCAGDNSYGQLGDGTTTPRLSPVPVSGLSGVTALAAALISTCALKSDGTVYCWGDNTNGQLGNQTISSSLTPVQVYGLTGVVSIAGGILHYCAVKSDGTVWCWGDNTYGQLGDGTTALRAQPTKVVF